MSGVAAVLIYNQYLPELLQNFPQLIVIDNGSTHPLSCGHKTLRLPENSFFTGGWNRAMEWLSHYDWVWMLNSDVTGIFPDQLPTLLSIASALGPDCAGLSPAYNSPHPHMNNQHTMSPRAVTWLDWSGPLISMAWWEKVGGFDTRFYGYGSDLDWCRRAADLGGKFYVTDQINFHHLGAMTAYHEGLGHLTNDVGRMNQLLAEKWKVRDWTQLFP